MAAAIATAVLFFGSILAHELGARAGGAAQGRAGQGHHPVAVRRAARFEAEADPADELRISGVGPAFGLALIGLGIVELAFGAGLGGTWLISSAGSCSPAARAQQA